MTPGIQWTPEQIRERLVVIRERQARHELTAGHLLDNGDGDHISFLLSLLDQRNASLLRMTEERDRLIQVSEFAAGAIIDAIGCEDGLDGNAGEAVLTMLRDALAFAGKPIFESWPAPEDEPYAGPRIQDVFASLARLTEAHERITEERNQFEREVAELRADRERHAARLIGFLVECAQDLEAQLQVEDIRTAQEARRLAGAE